MPTSELSSNLAIAKLVERQMRNWEFARAQHIEASDPHETAVREFITVSRAVGSAGTEVAQHIGERLRWPVFDKEILEAMAGDDTLHKRLYRDMDERDLNWFEEILRSFSSGKYAKNDYFQRLCRTVLALARQSHGVFVGRAADLILPRNMGLRVRVIEPRTRRIENYASTHGLEARQAENQILEIENQRSEFIQHHFRVSAVDDSRHDLIINLGHWSTDEAVALVLHAWSMVIHKEHHLGSS